MARALNIRSATCNSLDRRKTESYVEKPGGGFAFFLWLCFLVGLFESGRDFLFRRNFFFFSQEQHWKDWEDLQLLMEQSFGELRVPLPSETVPYDGGYHRVVLDLFRVASDRQLTANTVYKKPKKKPIVRIIARDNDTNVQLVAPINPFRTPVPFWGQTT